MGDPENWVSDSLDARQADHGLRAPHLPRRGSALAHPQAHGARARLAADRGRASSSRRLRSRSSSGVIPSGRCGRTSSTTRRSCSTSPRSRRRSRRRCSPARASPAGRRTSSSRSAPAGCSGRLRATSGPAPRSLAARRDARRGGCRGGRPRAGRRRARARAAPRRSGTRRSRPAARDADYRVRAQAYRAIAQFRFRQKLELLRRGLEDESPAARGSALIALEASRATIPATSTRSARCSTTSPRATRTSRCGASRSSACGTARRSATRSSCSTASPTRTRRTRSCARRRARCRRCS